MKRVEHAAVVASPPREVFAFVADLDNLAEWQSGIVEARTTSRGPMAVGTTARVIRELAGQRVEAALQVTAYGPPRRLEVASEVGGVKATGEIAVEAKGNGSRVTFSMEISGSGLRSFLEPMIADAAGKDIEASLRRLQERFSADR